MSGGSVAWEIYKGAQKSIKCKGHISARQTVAMDTCSASHISYSKLLFAKKQVQQRIGAENISTMGHMTDVWTENIS